jgi:hypothetical protein
MCSLDVYHSKLKSRSNSPSSTEHLNFTIERTLRFTDGWERSTMTKDYYQASPGTIDTVVEPESQERKEKSAPSTET